MDVIGHYHEGVQVILTEFGIAEFGAAADAISDARVFEPKRACFGAIEVLVGSCKFLACGRDLFGAEFLQAASG